MSEWISCSERLPSDDDEVLIHEHGCVYYGNYINGKFITQAYSSMGECDDWVYYNVTHWMPLPLPPEGEDK